MNSYIQIISFVLSFFYGIFFDIFSTINENILVKNQILSEFIKKEFSRLEKFDFLGNFRTCGMISAFDILSTKYKRVGLFVFQKALEKGLLLRPLANTIYFMPPYIITKEQIIYVVESLEQIFKEF